MSATPEHSYYFAYGSNMNPGRVAQRGMAVADLCAGVLPGYQLAFNKRSQKYPGAASANVMPASLESQVEGVLYRLTTAQQIEMMDPFEGYPRLYTRQLCRIFCEWGDCQAWTYLANPEHRAEGLQPARWYLQHLLAGERFLSPQYYAALKATPCLANSDVEPGG